MSETSFNSSSPSDDSNSENYGYNLFPSEHTSKIHLLKNYSSFDNSNIQYLPDCINFKLKNGDKLCNISIDPQFRLKTTLKLSFEKP